MATPEDVLAEALATEMVGYYKLYDFHEVWRPAGARALADWLVRVGWTLPRSAPALWEPDIRTTRDDTGAALEWSALSRALDAADDVMMARGHSLSSFANEEYAAVLRVALAAAQPPPACAHCGEPIVYRATDPVMHVGCAIGADAEEDDRIAREYAALSPDRPTPP